jgi:hypothetical protein
LTNFANETADFSATPPKANIVPRFVAQPAPLQSRNVASEIGGSVSNCRMAKQDLSRSVNRSPDLRTSGDLARIVHRHGVFLRSEGAHVVSQ